MVSRGSDRFVVWPRYFDARCSRAEGRRVPKELAVPDPKFDAVREAAKKAGLDAQAEEEARHPAVPFRTSGRLLVKKRGSKDASLRAIGERLGR